MIIISEDLGRDYAAVQYTGHWGGCHRMENGWSSKAAPWKNSSTSINWQGHTTPWHPGTTSSSPKLCCKMITEPDVPLSEESTVIFLSFGLLPLSMITC